MEILPKILSELTRRNFPKIITDLKSTTWITQEKIEMGVNQLAKNNLIIVGGSSTIEKDLYVGLMFYNYGSSLYKFRYIYTPAISDEKIGDDLPALVYFADFDKVSGFKDKPLAQAIVRRLINDKCKVVIGGESADSIIGTHGDSFISQYNPKVFVLTCPSSRKIVELPGKRL